ncbi:MAG: hypothetical protein WBQ09_17920 [Terriglobales bacterium]|jgi:hypothetical protein
MGHNIEDHAIQKFGKVAREMLGGWCDKKTDASGLTPKDKDRLHDQVTAIRIADFMSTLNRTAVELLLMHRLPKLYRLTISMSYY